MSTCRSLQICWYPEGSGRFPEACPEAYMFFAVSLQFRKVPEGFRKLVRKLVSFLCVCLQFRKVPEGSWKLVRKLVWRDRFTAFRKLPEGFRKPYRKGFGTWIDWLTFCKLDKFTGVHISDQHRCRHRLWWRRPYPYSFWVLVSSQIAWYASILAASKMQVRFPQAFRKLSGRFPEADKRFVPRGTLGPFRVMLCFAPNSLVEYGRAW